ncbi:cell division protein FtsQ/DivIB [Deinococcus sp.]|uniref:cell division protein FtsQ/DivIB n=1 Tax=Deinococcus sp. TaxID=47478 RepID=UPI003B5C7C01
MTPPDEVIPGDAVSEAARVSLDKPGDTPSDSAQFGSEQPEPDAFSSAQSSPDDNLEGNPADSPSRRTFWQRARVPLFSVLALAVIVGVAAGLWYGLPIREVQIQGQSHLTSAEVKRLAGLSHSQINVFGGRSFGWVYYGAWRAHGLTENPWIASASLTRVFPDRVEIAITERVAVAQVRDRDGKLSIIAADGTRLPDAAPIGPIISGWGPDRIKEALRAAEAFSRYNVDSVTYTPTGMTVKTAIGTIWSGDPALLTKYGSAIETQAQGGRINLYPWGVSVQK